MTRKPSAPHTRKTTAEVAIAAHQDHGLDKIIKAAELIHARPAKGKMLGLAASKALNLMLGVAGAAGFEDRIYSIPKKDLRRSHKGNERIDDWLDELRTTQFSLETISPRGRPAKLTAPLLGATIEEIDDQDDSLLYFRFTPEFVAVHKRSNLWAALSGPTLIRFDSTYALRLYEIGCQMVGRHDPTMRLTVPELRELLHVPADKYRDWTDLRRKTLDAAVAEIEQLAHFRVVVPEDRIRRSGRKVVSLELQFLLKHPVEKAAASQEVERHSVGRRARREGAVEEVVDTNDPELLWDRVKRRLEQDPWLRSKPVKQMLAQLKLVEVDGTLARIQTSSSATAGLVSQHYDQVFRDAFRILTGGQVSEFEITFSPQVS